MTSSPFRDILREAADLGQEQVEEGWKPPTLESHRAFQRALELAEAGSETQCRNYLAALAQRHARSTDRLEKRSRAIYDRITEALKVSRKAKRGD